MQIVRLINNINRVLSYIAMVMIVVMMLFITLDVLLRFIFNSPIVGSTEITRMFMVSLILLFGRCALEGKHIRVDALINRFSTKVYSIVEIIVLIITLGLCIFITWQSWESTMYMQQSGLSFSVLKVPFYPFHLITTIGLAMLSLSIISLIIQDVSDVIKN